MVWQNRKRHTGNIEVIWNGTKLINISDLAVLSEYRGQQVGRRLLEAVERKARKIGCCKLTIEVQEFNHRARHLYEGVGFSQAVYVEAAGGALFLAKPLIKPP